MSKNLIHSSINQKWKTNKKMSKSLIMLSKNLIHSSINQKKKKKTKMLKNLILLSIILIHRTKNNKNWKKKKTKKMSKNLIMFSKILIHWSTNQKKTRRRKRMRKKWWWCWWWWDDDTTFSKSPTFNLWSRFRDRQTLALKIFISNLTFYPSFSFVSAMRSISAFVGFSPARTIAIAARTRAISATLFFTFFALPPSILYFFVGLAFLESPFSRFSIAEARFFGAGTGSGAESIDERRARDSSLRRRKSREREIENLGKLDNLNFVCSVGTISEGIFEFIVSWASLHKLVKLELFCQAQSFKWLYS